MILEHPIFTCIPRVDGLMGYRVVNGTPGIGASQCRSPICWTKVGESSITGLDLIRDISEKVGFIRKSLLTNQSRQKSYVDR